MERTCFHSLVFQGILHTCRGMCVKYHLKAVTPGASQSLWIQISGSVLVDFTIGPPVCIGLRPFSSSFSANIPVFTFATLKHMCFSPWGRERPYYIVRELWYVSNVAACASTIFGQDYDLPEHLESNGNWLVELKANSCLWAIKAGGTNTIQNKWVNKWAWSTGLKDFTLWICEG